MAFAANGLNVNGLVLNNAPLQVSGGTFTRFDNVTFQGYGTGAVPLSFDHPGLQRRSRSTTSPSR